MSKLYSHHQRFLAHPSASQVLWYIRPQCWKVDPACGLCSPRSPAKSASSLWEGEAATTLLTHGPSADPSWASWRGDATFPSPGTEHHRDAGGSEPTGRQVSCPWGNLTPPPWLAPQRSQSTSSHPFLGTAALCPLLLQPCVNHPALKGNAAWSQGCLQVTMWSVNKESHLCRKVMIPVGFSPFICNYTKQLKMRSARQRMEADDPPV